jgi:glycosyltransferase involved in cell wall biosynthesis
MEKRILIPTINFTKKGGIERYNVELARFLSKKYKVDILCKSYEKNLINHNINIVKASVPSNRYLSYLFPIYISRKYIKNNRHKYFCIINNGIGATTIQDILIAQSCHKGWLRSLLNEGFPKILLDPANLIICGIEKYNYT